MLALSRKGFIGNLCRNMEGRCKGLRVRETRVLNLGGFPSRPPQAHAVGGGLVVGKKQRKFWCSISAGSGLVVAQGQAPEFVCEMCAWSHLAFARCPEKSVAQKELSTTGCLALSGTHGVALGKSLDLEDTVSSSQHVSEGIMMNISQVWYKG